MVVAALCECGSSLIFTTSYPVGDKTFKRMQCASCGLVYTIVVQVTVLEVLKGVSAYTLAKKERGLENPRDPASREQQSDSSLS